MTLDCHLKPNRCSAFDESGCKAGNAVRYKLVCWVGHLSVSGLRIMDVVALQFVDEVVSGLEDELEHMNGTQNEYGVVREVEGGAVGGAEGGFGYAFVVMWLCVCLDETGHLVDYPVDMRWDGQGNLDDTEHG